MGTQPEIIHASIAGCTTKNVNHLISQTKLNDLSKETKKNNHPETSKLQNRYSLISAIEPPTIDTICILRIYLIVLIGVVPLCQSDG